VRVLLFLLHAAVTTLKMVGDADVVAKRIATFKNVHLVTACYRKYSYNDILITSWPALRFLSLFVILLIVS